MVILFAEVIGGGGRDESAVNNNGCDGNGDDDNDGSGERCGNYYREEFGDGYVQETIVDLGNNNDGSSVYMSIECCCDDIHGGGDKGGVNYCYRGLCAGVEGDLGNNKDGCCVCMNIDLCFVAIGDTGGGYFREEFLMSVCRRW